MLNLTYLIHSGWSITVIAFQSGKIHFTPHPVLLPLNYDVKWGKKSI